MSKTLVQDLFKTRGNELQYQTKKLCKPTNKKAKKKSKFSNNRLKQSRTQN